MHRLRDLDRRQTLIAVALVAMVLVPFVASVVRAVRIEWLPSGDDALIGLRARDVFSAYRPLVGQPSTSHLYGPEQGTAHPGPIEFYWLAIPIRVLGPNLGMILGIAAVTLASVLVSGWVVLRRAGPGVATWAMVLTSLLLWSEGTAILTDPISSNAGGIPLLALAALTWAVVDGDVRLLPLAALFGSWVAQQHLAIVMPAAALVAFAVVGVVARIARNWRRSWRGDWPWIAGAVAVAVVCWFPVMWEQATRDPGNISAVIEYAQETDTESVGVASGVRQAIRAVGSPPLLTRSDLTGIDFFAGPIRPLETVVGVVSYLVLVATVVGMWRRRRTLALLAATALVLAVGGAVNGSTIPDSIEAFRINFYRWTFVVAWLAWIVFGWLAGIGVVALLERRGRALPPRVPRLAPVAAVAAMFVPAVATVFTAGYNDERRDQSGFVVMRDLSEVAVAEAEGAERVTLVLRGRSAYLASGSALTLQLEHAGHRVVLPGQEARFYGEQRILEPGDDPGEVILQLVSGRGEAPDGPGTTVARFDMNEELRSTLGPLVASARTAEVVPSARADDILAAHFEPDQYDYVRELMAGIGADPEPILTDARLLAMMIEGYYDSPAFDRDELETVLASLPANIVNDDDVFELRVLTEADLAAVVPEWAAP